MEMINKCKTTKPLGDARKKGEFSIPFSPLSSLELSRANLDNFDDHQQWEWEGEDDQDKREESQQMGTDPHTSFLAHFKYTLIVKLLTNNDIQKGKWQIGIS